jgi:hypothetical protein
MKSSRTGDTCATPSSTDLSLEKSERADVGRWWRRFKNAPLADAVGQVTLPQALHDVSVMALAHMARRLGAMGTPASVKDKIALALGPKVFIHAHAGVGPVDDTAQELLDAYEPADPSRKLDS